MAIPKLMCTQHPDSTVKVTAGEEVEEALVGYIAYGCDEVMVDYEGKLTPYAQPKEIVMKAPKAGVPLGESFYITVRLPNPKLEEFDRAMLSLEAAITANYFSKKYFDKQAVRWVVLPMVEDIDTVLLVRRMLKRRYEVYKSETGVDIGDVEVIPLLEDAFVQLKVKEILGEVFRDLDGGEVRVFFGKSDSAVKHGHLASSLSLVYALSNIPRLEEELGLKIRPIIGMGSPPFRGGINNPKLSRLVAEQYAGYYTATIQSAVRYDVSIDEYYKVKDSILDLCCIKKAASHEDAIMLITEASSMYRSIVYKHVDVVTEMARFVPSTRDRVSWREYGRVLGQGERVVNMPRAIVYTATWYSLGVPPTLLDAPYLLKLVRGDRLEIVKKTLPSYFKELEYDFEFFDPATAERFISGEVVRAVLELADYLGIKTKPNPAYTALLKMPRSESNIIAMAKFRKFLG
ncbi:MAG: phosphoenolpyruvate carboxylase [Pyrobaculum sp.]|jgi:phosphoenolpyruvate carboxylase